MSPTRKNTRNTRNTRKEKRGGKRARGRPVTKGIFGSLLKPVSTFLRGVGDILGFTVSKTYKTVRHVANHAEKAIEDVTKNVSHGAAGIVDRSAGTLNRTVKSVIGKRKNRKA